MESEISVKELQKKLVPIGAAALVIIALIFLGGGPTKPVTLVPGTLLYRNVQDAQGGTNAIFTIEQIGANPSIQGVPENPNLVKVVDVNNVANSLEGPPTYYAVKPADTQTGGSDEQKGFNNPLNVSPENWKRGSQSQLDNTLPAGWGYLLYMAIVIFAANRFIRVSLILVGVPQQRPLRYSNMMSLDNIAVEVALFIRLVRDLSADAADKRDALTGRTDQAKTNAVVDYLQEEGQGHVASLLAGQPVATMNALLAQPDTLRNIAEALTANALDRGYRLIELGFMGLVLDRETLDALRANWEAGQMGEAVASYAAKGHFAGNPDVAKAAAKSINMGRIATALGNLDLSGIVSVSLPNPTPVETEEAS